MVVVLNSEARKLVVAALLVAVSILAVQPSLVHASPQSVTMTARGSANPTASGMGDISPSANLYLIGTANVNGENIQFSQMTGIFQIGPTFYRVTGGQGQSTNQNTIQLNLQVSGSNPGPLVLQGQVSTSGEGYTILFVPQQSNLENQYTLWLYGNLWIHS